MRMKVMSCAGVRPSAYVVQPPGVAGVSAFAGAAVQFTFAVAAVQAVAEYVGGHGELALRLEFATELAFLVGALLAV